MTWIAAGLLALNALLLWLGARERGTRDLAIDAERAAWREERAELLERIQRPDTPPHLHVPRRHTPSDEDRQRAEAQARQLKAYAQVGTAQPLRVDGDG